MSLGVVVALRWQLTGVSRWSIDGDILGTIGFDDSNGVVDQNIVVRPANDLIHSKRSKIEWRTINAKNERLLDVSKERSTDSTGFQVDEGRFFSLLVFVVQLTFLQLDRQGLGEKRELFLLTLFMSIGKRGSSVSSFASCSTCHSRQWLRLITATDVKCDLEARISKDFLSSRLVQSVVDVTRSHVVWPDSMSNQKPRLCQSECLWTSSVNAEYCSDECPKEICDRRHPSNAFHFIQKRIKTETERGDVRSVRQMVKKTE